MDNNTEIVYFWETELANGKVLTLRTKKPFSTSLCDQIKEETGGAILDALVEELSEYRSRRMQESANV